MSSALELNSYISSNASKKTFLAFNFDYLPSFSKSKIIAKIGEGNQFINENFIFSKAVALANLLQKKQLNKVLIYYNDNDFSLAFAGIFSRIFKEFKIQTVYFGDFENNKITIAKEFFVNNDFDFFIGIQSIFNEKTTKTIEMFFNHKQLALLTLEDEKFLNNFTINEVNYNNESKEIPKIDNYFMDLNYQMNKFPLNSLKNKYEFFDNNNNRLEAFLKANLNKSENILPIKTNILSKFSLNKFKSNIAIWRKIFSSLKNKSDFVFWLKEDEVQVAYLQKFFYKVISEEDFQLLVLDYILKNHLANAFFLISKDTPDFILEKIKTSFNNIQIFNPENGELEKLFFKIKENQNEVFVLNNNKIFWSPKDQYLFLGQDSSFIALWYLQILEFYKENNLNIIEVIDFIKQNHNFVFKNKMQFFADNKTFSNFVDQLIFEQSNKINIINYEISEQNFNNNIISIKIGLPKNDYLKITYSKIHESVEVSSFFHSSNYSYKESVFLEYEIQNKMKIAKKDNLQIVQSSNKYKNILKFGFFISAIISIIFLLLYKFYNASFSNGSPTEIFNKFYEYFLSDNLAKSVVIINFALFWVSNLLIGMQLKRILRTQNIKVKFKHMFAGSIIAYFMQFSTPFSFGGEISYYWYFNKKGYPLKNVSATLTYNALIHQLSQLIISLIFIPIGFYYFSELFVFNSIEKILFFVWLIINIFLNVVVLAIIFIISVWKKLQYWLIKIFVKILNLRYLHQIEDLKKNEFKYQFFIDNFKIHFLEIFANKKLLFEVLFFYKFLPFVINFSFLTLLITMKNGGYNIRMISAIDYLKFISGNTILAMSNNLSPSPGGVGFVDLTTKIVFQNFFKANDLLNLNIFNFANRLFNWFIPYFVSSIAIITVWIGEKRNDKYQEIKKAIEINPQLKTQFSRSHSRFYWITLPLLFAIGASLLLLVFFH